MAEKESAVAKWQRTQAEKARAFKVTHDVERVHHLIAAAHLMRDYPPTTSLASALNRELAALSLTQADLDAEEKAENEKTYIAAVAADAPAPEPESPKASKATQADNAKR